MDNFKYILVPESKLKSLKDKIKQLEISNSSKPVTSSNADQAALDHMSSVLKETIDSTNLSEDEKAKHYSDGLNKLLTLKKTVETRQNQPIPVTVTLPAEDFTSKNNKSTVENVGVSDNSHEIDNSNNVSSSSSNSLQDSSHSTTGNFTPLEQAAVSTIQTATGRKRATQLLHLVKGSSINWSPTGQLIYNGHAVPGSNMVDIIHDLASSHKKKWSAVGVSEILQDLASLNAPEILISNKKHRETLNQLKTLSSQIPQTPSSQLQRTAPLVSFKLLYK